jgi:uncharacterized membrane protein
VSRARSVVRRVVRRTQNAAQGDGGQLILLVIGFALITALLVTVVVNASNLFLMRRSLAALADGAAVAAANGIDERALYTNGLNGGRVPLSEAAAEGLVRDYLESYLDQTGASDRFPQLQLVDVTTNGGVATVSLRVRMELPFINAVSEDHTRGVRIRAVASARLNVS